jgi:hypothetical protein
MKKKNIFFLGGLVTGIASGVVLSQTWKVLMKEGIKAGILAGRRIREVSQQAIEDVEDIAAEAAEEVAERDQQGRAVGS